MLGSTAPGELFSTSSQGEVVSISKVQQSRCFARRGDCDAVKRMIDQRHLCGFSDTKLSSGKILNVDSEEESTGGSGTNREELEICPWSGTVCSSTEAYATEKSFRYVLLG